MTVRTDKTGWIDKTGLIEIPKPQSRAELLLLAQACRREIAKVNAHWDALIADLSAAAHRDTLGGF